MKFQKMIRVQMMLVGLGAGLLLARPVRAQQEVNPTLFEEAQAAPQLDQAAAVNAAPSLEAVKAAASDAAAPMVVGEVGTPQLAPMDANVIIVLMIGIGSIVLFGLGEAVRGSRRRTWREVAPSGFPAGATAN